MNIADDYAAIAQRMRGEPDPIQEQCPTCWGAGWIESSYQAAGAPNFDECPDCHNPKGKLAP